MSDAYDCLVAISKNYDRNQGPLVLGWANKQEGSYLVVAERMGDRGAPVPADPYHPTNAYASGLTGETIDEWIGFMFMILRNPDPNEWFFRLDDPVMDNISMSANEGYRVIPGRVPVQPRAGVFWTGGEHKGPALRKAWLTRWPKMSKEPEPAPTWVPFEQEDSNE